MKLESEKMETQEIRIIDISKKCFYFFKPPRKLTDLRKSNSINDMDFEKLYLNYLISRMTEYELLYASAFEKADKVRFEGFSGEEANLIEDVLNNNADFLLDWYNKAKCKLITMAM